MIVLRFADINVKKAYERLKKSEFQDLYKHLARAFKDIEKTPSCGISIPKKLIPKVYIKKYGIVSLFKYDLPAGWRLIYSLDKDGIEVIAIILEWMKHKDYEKRFKYKSR
ncbi:MAG: hypothetical protein KAS32_03865 [Candidatus Peribacteraceae bacterium]|nr:hypothetical protein [Candidatus Peribacteraceae bacterium]